MVIATTLRSAHITVGFCVVFANAIAGFWALAAYYREPFRRRELWWFTIGAQILLFAQATLGVAIQSSEDLEPPEFHLLYGFSMLVAVAILYSYRQQMDGPQRYLLYAGGGLFLMGLGIRAMLLA